MLRLFVVKTIFHYMIAEYEEIIIDSEEVWKRIISCANLKL